MSEGQQQDPNTNDPGAQEPPVDWHDKFLGQKKVNGDLEAKLKAAYEKADRVDDLEKQVADWEKRGKEFDSAQATIAGLQKQVLQANVTAAATGKLINPGDALKLIDFSDLTADDQGGYDPERDFQENRRSGRSTSVSRARREQGWPGGNHPTVGRRDGDHQAGQLTRDDLKNMTTKQIDEARRKGRLDDLLAGRSK